MSSFGTQDVQTVHPRITISHLYGSKKRRLLKRHSNEARLSQDGLAWLAKQMDDLEYAFTHRRDSKNLIEARQASLPASTMPPSSSLGVVGKDSYRLRGVPECHLAVLGSKLATWSTGWPVVIVRGLKGAIREGEVIVVADIPPPEWILSHQWPIHPH